MKQTKDDFDTVPPAQGIPTIEHRGEEPEPPRTMQPHRKRKLEDLARAASDGKRICG